MIESYELAFRMQNEMPRVMDLSGESEATKKLYGIADAPSGDGRGQGAANGSTDDFGRKCLLARRLVEAGVRFVEISHGDWDQHFNLTHRARQQTAARSTSRSPACSPISSSAGLLKDTLVIWGGEFGRTPHAQGNDGRDHNNKGFTMWMAGGGVKGGFAYGPTDDYGYEAVENKVHVHDLHATILHLLGLDHEKLTYRYAGRDFRLTDVKGNVVKEIMA